MIRRAVRKCDYIRWMADITCAESGCVKPAANEPCSAGLRWAKAGLAVSAIATAARTVVFFIIVPFKKQVRLGET